MKLIRLLLEAFGPFTDTEIDFGGENNSSGANLHLVYGPNEAGKSSALRAMTDLRFGIPLRSPDDFVHSSADLRIAGVFVGPQGKPVGLVRRKARKGTLLLFDASGGNLTNVGEAGPEYEVALTGGLERKEFEAMFGLNHLRLREGGARLVQGEGELGVTLFEASSGTRGIAAVLASLDEDAKVLFSPRSKNATINEARRALDEHRRVWKDAQIRPAEWQERNRGHERAQESLAQIEQALEGALRRENELTELRTVAPLLRAHDLALTELEGLNDVPDLPETARESRLAAQQALEGAEANVNKGKRELARCHEALRGLVIEERLLAHADGIERLASNVEPMARSRIQVRQHQAKIDQITEEIVADATRFAPGSTIEEVLAAIPSDADRTLLNHHLSEITRLKDRVENYRSHADQLDNADRLDGEDSIELPDPEARGILVHALQQAQKLGDTLRQAGDIEREILESAGKLTQALADLDIDSVDALRRSRPLLESQIDSVRKTISGIDEDTRKLRGEHKLLDNDLAQQRREERRFAAAGDIATADTLRNARVRRDEGWTLIRKAYIERSADPGELGRAFDAARSLPEAFETAQAAADHQADVLCADTSRAALYAECTQRITQILGRQGEIAKEIAVLGKRREAALETWFQKLGSGGLPRLDPDTLGEWQTRRQAAVERAATVESLRAQRDRLVACETEAGALLTAALQAIGEKTTASDLPALIKQASAWERDATERFGKHAERIRAKRQRQMEREEKKRLLAVAETKLQSHIADVQAWHARLFIKTGSSIATFKAHLEEMNRLARREMDLRTERLQRADHQAVVDNFEEQATQLALLLGEPQPQAADDFAEQLKARLKISREREQQRLNLARDMKKAEEMKHEAEAEMARASSILKELCAAAGMEDVAKLPECEERSTRKRQLNTDIARQRQQLAQASVHTETELRERLADQDTIAIEAERDRCRTEIARLKQEQTEARRREEQARRALEEIDTSDAAAKAREAMESAAAKYRAAIGPWVRLRLSHALLRDSLKRFRERAQAPMLAAASTFFSLVTDGRYPRLVADDTEEHPVLRAERYDGKHIRIEAMSEGTADQLYLSLRLAALQLRRDSHPHMPLVLDDVLITSDDTRSANVLRALAQFAEGGQVMLFTHHRHLIELAQQILTERDLAVHDLSAATEGVAV